MPITDDTPGAKGPVVRALDASDVDADLEFDVTALAASLASHEAVDDTIDDETPDETRPRDTSKSALLMAARFGESSRQDLGLTQRESKKVEDDPFMKRLGEMS